MKIEHDKQEFERVKMKKNNSLLGSRLVQLEELQKNLKKLKENNASQKIIEQAEEEICGLDAVINGGLNRRNSVRNRKCSTKWNTFLTV